LKPEDLAALEARRVSPAVVALASEAAPNKQIVLAGAGSFEQSHITMTRGLYLGDEELDAERLLENWHRLESRAGEVVPATGSDQYQFEVARARGEV
jgi:hypothetical protein